VQAKLQNPEAIWQDLINMMLWIKSDESRYDPIEIR
jgi:hypothetical protein